MNSFFQYLTGSRRVRMLFVIAAPFFTAVFIANVLAASIASDSAEYTVSDLTAAPKNREGAVAGTFTGGADDTITISPVQTASPTPTPMKETRKKSYTVAVYGDSMVDTMGERLEYLEGALKDKYPATTFRLYNYGTGAQNVEQGLDRFGNEFHYKDRSYTSVPVLSPDIIVIGSFAYNPFTPHDRNRHWLALARLIQEAKRTGADVYMLAENAPLRTDFGKGPNGVNWDQVTAFEHSGRIIEQLENAVGLAKNENVILINAFEKSIINNRREGKKEYVNPSDGIHPSVDGHKFIAEEIAETLVLDY